MEKTELNLENPIFVFYIDVSNMSRQSAEDYISHFKKTFCIYSNITSWIVASDITKVECVYDGKSKIKDKELTNIISEINKRIDILSNSKDFEDFKVNVRDWRLSDIIEKNR